MINITSEDWHLLKYHRNDTSTLKAFFFDQACGVVSLFERQTVSKQVDEETNETE